jgi:ParB family transcriptional regulator, chromosome partitioning protein
MKKPRGLGRGLGALFSGGSSVIAADARVEADGKSMALLPIDAIEPNRYQPRRDFDAAELESLAQSIRAHGVLSPIMVRTIVDDADRYELIAGERRWRAARIAGLTHVPALVRTAADAQALELALIENLQREDLNSMEEAAGYRRLIDEHGFTQEMLAGRLGKARPTVTNALRLLSLPDAVQALVRDGALSAGHARALISLPASRATQIARAASARGLSVRDVERMAGEALSTKTKRGGVAQAGLVQSSPELTEVETRLRFALATRVAIRPSSEGGTIEVRYANDDELQRIVDAICPEEP